MTITKEDLENLAYKFGTNVLNFLEYIYKNVNKDKDLRYYINLLSDIQISSKTKIYKKFDKVLFTNNLYHSVLTKNEEYIKKYDFGVNDVSKILTAWNDLKDTEKKEKIWKKIKKLYDFCDKLNKIRKAFKIDI